ncbi:MAG: glycosyltransferase, partial [Acidimicrobiia bacterium]|nr:glycosyltransferase [Acidimicrobiia bacterium]
TLVTMHDFWWFCARQFLVDREFQPCCIVVDAGVCECQVSRTWLEQRNRYLSAALADVDYVLAPSRSAADVLAANGVPRSVLFVDENGLQPQSVRALDERAGEHDGVVFLYAGGSNRMKGVHILFDAARLLDTEHRPARPWRVDAYGVSDFVAETGTQPPRGISIHDSFSPDEVDGVYAQADVLIVPSVMRESHSLVTREALVRGIPVVTTDCLGPEEVVAHDVKGLIVPAADPEALAAAMARLVDDPDVVEHLRAGCQATPGMRSVEAQVQSLEMTYGRLLARRAPLRSSPERAIRRVLFVAGIDGAPLRYRARLPAEALSLMGIDADIRYYRDPDLLTLVDAADAVVFYRVPATVEVMNVLEQVRARGKPSIFDVDDLIFDADLAAEIPALQLLPADEASLWLEGVRRYRTTMEMCDAFVGSTVPLCRHASKVTGMHAEHFPNGVGLVLSRISDQALGLPRQSGPARIGYFSGTDTHTLDWRHIEPALVDVLTRHRGVELWLGGLIPDTPALAPFGARVVRLPMLPWTVLPSVLRDVDVNLAPLEPRNVFNESKSAIKWLEAALTATPTIASPTAPFCEAIEDGHNGLLADTTEDWARQLDWLVSDERARARLGRRARRDALLRWSPHLQAARYIEVLQAGFEAAAGGAARRAPRHAPLVLDEPPLPAPHRFEPYDSVQPATTRAYSTPKRLATLARRGMMSLRSEGPAATARRTAVFAHRQYEQRVRRQG